MTLIDMVRDLDNLDDEYTIYAAEPWTENSLAIVGREPASGGLSAEAEKRGLKYFIEVFIAREFLDGWTQRLNEEPTLQAKCIRLIEYAINDA